MGCRKSKVLFRGLSELYLSYFNLFWQFLCYRRRNKRVKTVASILSCGVLERGKNPYVESIGKLCISKNQEEIFAMCV